MLNYLTHRTYRVRLLPIVAGLAVLAGCSGSSGPSAKQVKLDMQQKMTRAYQGLVKTESFAVNDRKAVTDHRVKLHVTVRYGVDQAALRRYKHESHLGLGPDTTLLYRIKHTPKHAEKVTVYYRRQGDNWRLRRTRMGFQ